KAQGASDILLAEAQAPAPAPDAEPPAAPPKKSAPVAAAPAAQAPAPEAPREPAPARSEVTFGNVPDDEPEPLAPRQHPKLSPSRVFSNKDLESYRAVKREFGFKDGVEVVNLPDKGPDATSKPEALTPEERERQMAAARDRIRSLS